MREWSNGEVGPVIAVLAAEHGWDSDEAEMFFQQVKKLDLEDLEGLRRAIDLVDNKHFFRVVED